MSANRQNDKMQLNAMEQQLLSQFTQTKNIDNSGYVKAPLKKQVTYVHDSEDEKLPPLIGLGCKAT